MDIFRQLKSFYWPEKKLMFVSIAFMIVSTAMGLIYPNLFRYLIDEVISKNKFELVPKIALLVVLTMSVKAAFQFFHGLTGGRLGNKVAYQLRNALYDKLHQLSFQYYDQARTGDLMSRLTADLDSIRHFVGFGFAQSLNVILMFMFGIIMMFTISWELTLLVLITVPFIGYFAVKFERTIHPIYQRIRASMSSMNSMVQENITGVRTVKSFAREPFETDKFTERNDNYKATNLDTSEVWARYFPRIELSANITVVILLFFGGYMVIQEQITLGELVACFSIIWYIIGPIWGLGFLINQYTSAKASSEKIFDLLNEFVYIKDDEKAKALQLDQVKGRVTFENVTFSYAETSTVLHDFQLDAKPGSVIGILGATGSGKTTLVSLLMRAYNVNHGRILLDGQDIQHIQLASLRHCIATVFQETFLFSSTIRNNIAYGDKDASPEDIIRVAQLAQAHEFITQLPLGYDTIVGERGLGLSGGQKQRIAIARALLTDPKILVLDDSTSAVDMETEHQIQAGFREVMRGRTTFIIAHRISSLKHADEIIVLDHGRIVERGTHDQLLEQTGRYRMTYELQYADKPSLPSMKHKKGDVE